MEADEGTKTFFAVAIIVLSVFAVGFGMKYTSKISDNSVEALWNTVDDLKVRVNSLTENTTPKLSYSFSSLSTPTFEFVSSTEYTRGDGNGSTIIKLLDYKGNNINTTCYEKILYPDKSVYIDWSVMTQHWEYGNYYLNFAVPLTIGIYDQEVRCLVSNKNLSLGKGFHVGNLTDMIENKIDSKIDELHQDVMMSVT